MTTVYPEGTKFRYDGLPAGTIITIQRPDSSPPDMWTLAQPTYTDPEGTEPQPVDVGYQMICGPGSIEVPQESKG